MPNVPEDWSEKLARLRRDYVSQPLTEASIAADPVVQFQHWFEEGLRAEQPDPEAMTLATVADDGRVSARIVLLKGCDERGFVFFTNYESRKGRELVAHPQAALTFYWHVLNRQVRIEGCCEKVSPEESTVYFQSRPLGSQLGAWASPQSQPIASREFLEARVAEMTARFATEPLTCPPFWGGFLLRPDTVEFWQGRESRLHDRIVYARIADGWRCARLAP
jgi:pyridoxamine 5'-phosphate oxidase